MLFVSAKRLLLETKLLFFKSEDDVIFQREIMLQYPSHTALREASVTAKSAVVEALRRSRISIIAVV